ncbi:hypothetical protein [Bacillus sp. V5-8f]|uniref:hypothetical protein n=1 Tax=Bacillus sp. V5-8f TaxID=2053044 RepID=UPI000C764E14|nr:hypothetical protein [Bacillus sp. V5-8f]PLT32752.1 hypothetical protein CUU64_17760 [Bacillus sp. V5-8f]
MKAKVIKTILGGAIVTPIVLGVSSLLGGYNALAAGHGHHGPGGMEPRGGFEGHGGHMYGSHHHGGDLSWLGLLLFLIIGTAIVAFLVKWLRKKAKASSKQQFIDTSIISSHKPFKSQNERMLDEWEKNLGNKRENV